MTSRQITLTVLWLLSACTPTALPSRQYPLQVEARTGHNEPLPGVSVWLDGEPVGSTDEDGALSMLRRGNAGQRCAVFVVCPEGFSDPEHAREITLREIGKLSAQPEPEPVQLSVVCHAEQQTIVVAVHTGQPDLPILQQDQLLGRTNRLGVAHVALTVPRRGRFRLNLDTQKKPALRPQNPSKWFELKDEDAFVLWHQPIVSPKVYRPPPPPPPPPLPPAYRLH